MKKLNLILSCASLCVTVALLILSVFSWYVTNQEVNVTGIVASTAGEDLTFTLYYYDEDESEWTPMTDALVFENTLPGEAKYFKLVCENSGTDDITINGYFEGIQSKLDTDFVKVSGNYVTYNTVPAYQINNTSRAVLIDNRVLYSVQGSTISLGYYKIEEGFRIQYFGETETNGTESPSTTYNSIDNQPNDGTVRSVNSSLFENLIIPTTGKNLYFAFVYLDDDELNPYYMYQSLYLDALVIKKV